MCGSKKFTNSEICELTLRIHSLCKSECYYVLTSEWKCTCEREQMGEQERGRAKTHPGREGDNLVRKMVK